jgi:EAL domain-containing protein (putative c-di-GMP-specific phosphodiesterase class I)
VQRCRKVGIRTVCMLVEDAETLAHLRTIHVDYVQGFGVAKPRILED